MTVTAPPRPPRQSDPVDREEVEALVEALFEEARQAYPSAATHVLDCCRFRGTRRSRGVHGLRPHRTVAERFQRALRTAEPSGTGELEDRVRHRQVLQLSRLPAPRDERGSGSGPRLLAAARTSMPGLPTGGRSLGAGHEIPTGNLGIYVVNADGSGRRRPTRSPAATSLPPCPTGGRSPSAAGIVVVTLRSSS